MSGRMAHGDAITYMLSARSCPANTHRDGMAGHGQGRGQGQGPWQGASAGAEAAAGHGTVWCGVQWHGVAWHGVEQFDTV